VRLQGKSTLGIAMYDEGARTLSTRNSAQRRTAMQLRAPGMLEFIGEPIGRAKPDF